MANPIPTSLVGTHLLHIALDVELVDCEPILVDEEPGKVGLVILEVLLAPSKVEDEVTPVIDAVTVAGTWSR